MSPGRFWLGMVQMGASTIAIALLLWTGVSAVTLLATALATSVTLVSRRLYRELGRVQRRHLRSPQ